MTKRVRKKKSPGNRLLVHNIKKRPSLSHCRICGTQIRTHTMKSSKSRRHSARPFSGEVCHACLRTTIQSLEI
ncbi:MAG: hypothetical protein ACXAC8_01655 [Candidatus Hodarchaeales archaeon]|jgi:ribosomal protein L34E